MVTLAAHPVHMRTAGIGAAAGRPQLILERTDEDFLPAIFSELSRSGGATKLLGTIAKTQTANQVLKLYQPVQRVFNVALFELYCQVPGEPRFDPARIESAGMVVRRVFRDQRGFPHLNELEGWRHDGASFKEWVKFDSREERELDPDPAMRNVLRVGHPETDRRLALLRIHKERLSEDFTPLFTAPPEVCEALGKTIMIGVIPVTSGEQSEAPAAVNYTAADVEAMLSPMLKASGNSLNLTVPRAGEWLSARDADDPRLAPWINMLRQLVIELDAFGTSSQSLALFAALDGLKIAHGSKTSPDLRAGGEVLRQHAEVFVNREDTPPKRLNVPWPGHPYVEMPQSWPQLTADVSNAIAAAARASLEARLAAVVQPRAPRYDQSKRPTKSIRTGYYDETGQMYRIQAFARVRHHEHCPTQLVWSAPSDPFAIAPWYEGGGAPPVHVALPDPTDRAFLKSLKPNVTFAVPGNMMDMLQKNTPKALLAGEGSKGSMEIDWLCAFNIPIITICAFIMLSIVLSILDFFLHWMAFVKICIPIPRKA